MYGIQTKNSASIGWRKRFVNVVSIVFLKVPCNMLIDSVIPFNGSIFSIKVNSEKKECKFLDVGVTNYCTYKVLESQICDVGGMLFNHAPNKELFSGHSMWSVMGIPKEHVVRDKGRSSLCFLFTATSCWWEVYH